MKRAIRIAFGIIMLILGVVGWIFPVLQGWLFFIIGCVLLSPDIKAFQFVIVWIKKKFPRTRKGIRRIQNKMRG